ncbi:MAG: hypothetical protein QUS14_10810 [Pyrinomonadaceae bacterium]|nr:hypothetical protein [Pyrinomonadaceae bacterium]
MDLITQVRKTLGSEWISTVYESDVRPLRTRSFDLAIPQRENRPVVLHTLLGVELKVGRVRISCPDLGTARYLAVFAALGCTKVAVPYDITQVPVLSDRLERAWSRTFEELERVGRDIPPQSLGKMRARIVRELRNEIAAIGAGERMPLFNTSTRQRDN